jgi:Flp pilus assembly protein TadG
MVEFALVLPILVLLLVLAVDFGRVFFQWVGVTNATRIAANYAARNPDAWDSTPDTISQDEYRTLTARDLNPLNCLALNNTEVDKTDIPNPTFTGFELGDQTTVTLQCRFRVLTPIASFFVGGDLFTVSADSTFTVNGGRIAGVPVGNVPPVTGTPPCAQRIVPNLVDKTVEEAEAVWTARFTGAFTAPVGALPEDIVTGQTTTPAAAVGACVAATTSVTVTSETATTCLASEALVPSLVDMVMSDARDAWTDAGFTGAFLPATGLDDEIVTSQDVSSGHDPGECAPISALVAVGSEPTTDYCVAELLTGLSKSAAAAKYTGAGFTGDFKSTGNPSGTVTGQKLVAGQTVPCASDEDVKLTK